MHWISSRQKRCNRSLINTIMEKSKSDDRLAELLADAKEYAQVYVLARQRQKGCNGMGEVATLKDEFKGMLDELMNYCRQKGYIIDNILFDVDEMADEFFKDNK